MDSRYTLPALPCDYAPLEPHYSANLSNCIMTSTTPPTLRARTRRWRNSPRRETRAILRPSTCNLQTERFFKPAMINHMMAIGDGSIKTFPLQGIKDSPPYMHDGRLLTLEDTVEFFNLILSTKLTPQEKQDLVAFMRTL